MPAAAASFGSSELRATAKPLRVLIVDDERDTVISLMAIMRDEGYEVQGAFEGKTALDQLDEFDPEGPC